MLSLIVYLLQLGISLALVARDSNNLQENFLVKNLPGLTKNIPTNEVPLMFSGQLELYSENKTSYYFWKFVDQNKVEKAKGKTFFWLNGGPGCSSMDGALMEAGPFRIDKHGEVTYNEGSWHKAGDVVFVDQPAGTGFSFSDVYDVNLPGVVQHFLRFLDKYFEVFPEDANNDIYLTGESYAGQYIPFIARGILDRNKSNPEKINLKGLLIGNGWISPNEQSLSYLPYSHKAGILDIDNPQWSNILKQHDKCQNIVNQIIGGTLDKNVDANDIVSKECEKVLTMILSATINRSAPANQQCVNIYDYTLRDSYPSCGMNWPPDLSYVTPFLNNEDVLGQLNVNQHKNWKECSGGVGGHLKNRGIEPAVNLLPSILEEIPVLLFHGNRDIICNYIGAENFIKNLEWNGGRGFGEDSDSGPTDAINWVYEDEVVGYVKSGRNLTFVNVFDASHMVPFDKPNVSRSIIDLIIGEYEEDVSDDGKSQLITYPLGSKKILNPDPTVEEEPEISGTPSEVNSTGSSTESTLPEISSTTSRITRLIQLLVICILIWGIYVLYISYKSRPSSIIKTRPTSGKKKNVQWADQLRVFQDDIIDSDPSASFLSKAYNKITGKTGETNGVYASAPTNDIEMGNFEADPSNFEIHSEEDEEEEAAAAAETETETETGEVRKEQAKKDEQDKQDNLI